MKKADLKYFQDKLLAMRQDIAKTLEGTTHDLRNMDESKGYSQHQADEGSDDYDRSLSLNLSTREFELLTHIDQALSKIEDGTYGVCEISGEPIPRGRLEAIPYATTTVKAQEMLEKGIAS